MRIIDFHAHIYPDKIAAKAVESVGDFYNLKMYGDGTADGLILQGAKNGIDRYVVHSVAITPSRVQSVNDYIAMEANRHKEFIGFGTMHADFEDKIGEAERMVSLGLKGVKIHPDNQKFNIDDPKMFAFYDFLSEHHLPILIHCGDYRYDYSHPRRLKRLMKEFPNLIAVGAHFGGWSVYDLAVEYLLHTKCYLDTSSSFQMMGLKRGKELIRMYGAERILFGSDFPMWNSDEVKSIKRMKLTEEENELIFHQNAERVLGIHS